MGDGSSNTSTTPGMQPATSNSSPYTITTCVHGLESNSGEAWKAFDQEPAYGDRWCTSSCYYGQHPEYKPEEFLPSTWNTDPSNIMIDLGEGNEKCFDKFTYSRSEWDCEYFEIHAFILQGSNVSGVAVTDAIDSSDWDELYSWNMQEWVAPPPDYPNDPHHYIYGENNWYPFHTFINNTAYRYYRICVRDEWNFSNGTGFSVQEFMFVEEAASNPTTYETSDMDTSGFSGIIDAMCNRCDVIEIAGLIDGIDAESNTPRDTISVGASDNFDAILMVGISSNISDLSDIIDVSAQYNVGNINISGVSESTDARSESASSLEEIGGARDSISANYEYRLTQADITGISAHVDALNFSQILSLYATSPRQYHCILTGSEAGLEDLIVPASSIQARLRQGEPNYLMIVTPGKALAADIAARPSGQLVVYMAIVHQGVEIIREEIARADLESIRIDEGPRSTSVTLSGHRTVTYSAQSSVLRDVNYRSVLESGALMIRCSRPDFYLRPGDTCTYGSDTFVAGLVQYTIGASQQIMTVTEAP